MPAREVAEIELRWIHSIEKTPWAEVYRIDGTQFELTDVYLKSYGAGAPADIGGTTSIENGVIHISDLEREVPELTWVHSNDTQHTLTISYNTPRPETVIAHEFSDRRFLRAQVT
ncbi:DUF1850 domain-containing protein [Corynebacterium aquatimens]|uniref:DUF1850 domain-containing protein n=1 Tax=Corynebacterium TaxID=1716 RepID=UPI001F237193|nr:MULTISPECIES: DUF1850 domain-containing protein [Corynebacterium]QYH19523.1 DUF1850 domain-containing protein [Corynebacterium aquatimens]UIZ91533.1 DUF1850 domain-containing protein [Corynebacterium sp. CNCTC7651]